VLGLETKQALIKFQEREGLRADGRIDVRTSTALGISVRTEGRAAASDEKGRADQKGSGQAGAARPSESGGVNRPSDRTSKSNGAGNTGQNNRPSTTGQGGNSPNASAGEHKASGQNDRPTTSGRGGNPSSGNENRASGQPGGTLGQSMRPQKGGSLLNADPGSRSDAD
jgi:hypothetical protein